jgi:uncharacterized protein YeaO (DUF488 family)
MALKTRRWCAPAEPDDGLRVLVCRYRPRALPKAEETWDVWMKDLGPSPELFKAFTGKGGRAQIPFSTYRARYIEEMGAQHEKIAGLAARLDAGENVTLLCSKDCFLPEVCHRTALAELVEAARVGRKSEIPAKSL